MALELCVINCADSVSGANNIHRGRVKGRLPITNPSETNHGSVLKSQIQSDINIQTTEMHSGGMPVRIIESGYPVPQGENLNAKVEDLKKNHDAFRKLVIHEPHGHKNMYGVLLVAPDMLEADIGVIFMDNGTYATMCGHAVISVARYAMERNLVRRPITEPETQVIIQTPCGLVNAYVEVTRDQGIKTGLTKFESTPAFVVATDVEVEVEGLGKVPIDVAYGGSFYAVVEAGDLGLDLAVSESGDIAKIALKVKKAAIENIPISHPTSPAFYYGTMVVASRCTKAQGQSTSVCDFADGATDRSPSGSGTTARIALMYHRGLLALQESQTFMCGVTGSEFIGRPLRKTKIGDKEAIIVQIEGQGHFIGKSTLTLEKEDLLGQAHQYYHYIVLQEDFYNDDKQFWSKIVPFYADEYNKEFDKPWMKHIFLSAFEFEIQCHSDVTFLAKIPESMALEKLPEKCQYSEPKWLLKNVIGKTIYLPELKSPNENKALLEFSPTQRLVSV